MEPAQRRGRPPVPTTEQRHQARYEQGPDDRRVERDGDGGADTELLDERDARGRKGADRNAEQQRGGGDDAAGSLHPVGDGVAVVEAAVSGLLDAREEEDRVI